MKTDIEILAEAHGSLPIFLSESPVVKTEAALSALATLRSQMQVEHTKAVNALDDACKLAIVYLKDIDQLRLQLDSNKQRIDELKPYLRHLDDCMTEKVDSSMAEHYEIVCTCGLDDLLK